jgi:hypothetical protein
MPRDQEPKKKRQGVSLAPEHQLKVAELARRNHGGNVSAYLRDMIDLAHRGLWPTPQSETIIEDLVAYLYPAAKEDFTAELDRLGIRNQQRKLLTVLLNAYFSRLAEIEEAGFEPKRLTQLGVYVCDSKDFFANRSSSHPYRQPDDEEGAKVAESPLENPAAPESKLPALTPPAATGS